jgi:hypothetical protein
MKVQSNLIFENKKNNKNRRILRFWIFDEFDGFAAIYDFAE